MSALSGWHVRPDWRLSGHEAQDFATRLEATGRYWCQAFPLAQGVALLHVRSRRRPFPLRFTFRTREECEALLRASPPRGQEQQGGRQLPLWAPAAPSTEAAGE